MPEHRRVEIGWTFVGAAWQRSPVNTAAKLLLMETRYKLSKIAVMTGYGTASQFATAFKRYSGTTPGQFRK